MSDVQACQECLRAFFRHDYAACAQRVLELLPSGASHAIVQVLLISLQQLKQTDMLDQLGPQVLAATESDPWPNALLRLTLGQADLGDVLAAAQDEEGRCQAHYYGYWRLLELGQMEAAQKEIAACLATRANCLEYLHAQIEQRAPAPPTCDSLETDYEQQITELNREVVRFYQQRRYQEAIAVVTRARDLAAQHLGEEHPQFAASLNNLATLYHATGNYAAAEPLYRQALEIRRVALGENHPDFANSLNNLAVLYKSMGNYAAAEPLYRQALEICRAALGENHSDFATSLNNLAGLYRAMGNYAAAEPLLRQALEIDFAALGKDHPDFATSLNSLAGLYRTMGNYAAAEPLYRQALEIRRVALGEKHPDFAASLNNLAWLYHEMGNYAGAEPLYRQALEIRRVAQGENHPDFANSLNNLAWLYTATGRISEALSFSRQAADIDDRMIGQVFSIGSESQRTAFLTTIEVNFDVFLSLVWHEFPNSAEAVRPVLDLVLRRKAVGAEAMAVQRDAVLGGKYPHLGPQLGRWAALRMQIAQKTLTGAGPEGLAAHQQQLAEWNRQKEELEVELARRIPEMNLAQRLQAADRRAVALGLPEGVGLVEFVRFDVFDFWAIARKKSDTLWRSPRRWKPARYLAFVLSAGEPDSVQMIDLGDAAGIDRLIAEFRSEITGQGEGRGGRPMVVWSETEESIPAGDNGLRLREAVFDKVAQALGDHRRLFLAPDGDLTRVPFEALPYGEAGQLIDAYQISYLSVGRDVLRFGAASSGEAGAALVVADPQFDLTASSTVQEAAGEGEDGTAIGQAATVPGRQSRGLRDGRFHFGRLPGTRMEGQQIGARLGIVPCMEQDALEGRFKAACHSPRILHMATHGFFLEDQQLDPNMARRELGGVGSEAGGEGGRFSGPLPENPLLRSGLALAGAETWLCGGQPPLEAEDGLLTAEDVSGLDLLATDLVVLSACETGLGEVRRGEGVFGLRRAFVLAGAKTLAMSLWKVPDLATAILMDRFYENLLGRRLPRDQSLRDAQLTIRDLTVGEIRERWLTAEAIAVLSGGSKEEAERLDQIARQADEHRPFVHPKHWAAFICQGDPSPMT